MDDRADLVPAVLPTLQELAVRARSGRDYEPLVLAAYLFAFCTQLKDSFEDWRFRDEPVPPTPLADTGAACRVVEGWRAGADTHDLYFSALQALEALDAGWDDRLRDRHVLPACTPLAPPIAYGGGVLDGVVEHWLRPPSALARHREHRYQAARGARRPGMERPPEAHLTHLGMRWRRGGALRLTIARPWLRGADTPLETSDPLAFRIALCPLRPELHPRFVIDAQGRSFSACGVSDPVGLRDQLDRLVAAAVADRVSLLVLPELHVDDQARAHIQSRLRELAPADAVHLQGVLAGSYHVRKDGDELPRNQAVLFGRAGALVLEHCKAGHFSVPRKQVEALRERVFDTPTEALADEVHEGIRYGDELQLLETRLGRFAILICADAFQAKGERYRRLVREVRPDLVFVVSLSLETRVFARFARDLAENFGVGTVIVNAAWASVQDPREAYLGAVDLALHEPRGAPPVRVRWRHPRRVLTWRWHAEGPRQRKGWQRRRTASAGDGLAWLGGSPELGLIVDIGRHMGWDAQEKATEKYSLDTGRGEQ